MAATILHINDIISDPKLRDGQPIIAGTALRVADLVAYQQAGEISPSELAERFFLDVAQVHAALAYYHHHQAEIDAQIEQEAAEDQTWLQNLRGKGYAVSTDHDPDFASLSDEQLWRVVYQGLTWEQEQRLDILNEKARQQALSTKENSELLALLAEIQLQMFLRSHALLLLKRRDYNVEYYLKIRTA